MLPRGTDFLLAEDALRVAAARTGSPAYDFDFRTLLASRTVPLGDQLGPVVMRIGPLADYESLCASLSELGGIPINTVAEHVRASELSAWYPHLRDLTPESWIYDGHPTAAAVLQDASLPLFVKGDRQTSRHRADRAVARTEAELESVLRLYRDDDILHWQQVVVRKLVQLRHVGGTTPGGLPATFEFRTFWWKGEFVGAGPYWGSSSRFRWTDSERTAALKVAGQAASRLQVPFLVVDVAQDVNGRWLVIECNDAQESSYAGVNPLSLWRAILDQVRNRA